ncbi:class I SAM-dependent methyltransferase [Bifidobacterium magnum]|uniref:16S RNA methylase n=1 Tax=Bifidobacterium magnum TaxID=1692 RepID=A0A087BDV6_9BIFI|nr:methyltransferase [Bifidobacterium magnum]KFI69206.1 16S RNA methylase [Bifidobacterium magnum]
MGSNTTEQYFSATPASQDVRREFQFTIRDWPMTVTTSNGVFSSSKLDLGTQVLLKHAPAAPEDGNLLDLGCGWGPISLALAKESPDAQVWSVDVNERALELTALNAKANGCGNIRAVTADQVPEDVQFDAIWSNPPIRVGKEVLHELLMTWLPRLKPQGRAYLVVQKNLGSDSLMKWLAQQLGDAYAVSKYASSKGYRVIEVCKA